MCLPAHKEKIQRQALVYTLQNKCYYTLGQYLPRYTYTAAEVRFSVVKNTSKITVGISASVIIHLFACLFLIS